MAAKQLLLPVLQKNAEELEAEFSLINNSRKEILRDLARFVGSKLLEGETTYLNFICTHNSRRSHMSQLWAQAAAHFYGIDNVVCLSGGTEATAFNPRAVKAMQDIGFIVIKTKEGDNPVYEVRLAEGAAPVVTFSKKYDDPFNQSTNFVAIMTCSHADTNCPIVVGASKRIALTFNDPKDFDGTPLESTKYAERVREIGREILYAFSEVSQSA